MPPKPKQPEKFAWGEGAIQFSNLPESLQKYIKQPSTPSDTTEATDEKPSKDEEAK
jgi:hypothetical protein